MARILLRAEAVASSRIEGPEIGARRLLQAEVVRGLDEVSSDVTATEVLGNIDAMIYGVERIGEGDTITTDVLLGILEKPGEQGLAQPVFPARGGRGEDEIERASFAGLPPPRGPPRVTGPGTLR